MILMTAGKLKSYTVTKSDSSIADTLTILQAQKDAIIISEKR